MLLMLLMVNININNKLISWNSAKANLIVLNYEYQDKSSFYSY